MTFSSFNLNPLIMEALDEKGFASPSPIQTAAIPALLEDLEKDALLLAATGTGKTAAYGLPLIDHLYHNKTKKKPLVLVIVPTRELCIQVGEALKFFSSKIKELEVSIVYGGASIGQQARELSKNPAIIVATPGRLLDHIERKSFDPSHISHLVLDEGDELLTPGFLEDIEKVKSFLPEKHTSWMVSATLPDSMKKEIFSLLKDPLIIRAENSPKNPEKLEHICHCVRERHRFPALIRVLQANPGSRALIFCRTRKESQELSENLAAKGFEAEALHGDLSQAQRETTIKRFRQKRFLLLVATNVAARGIDLPGLPLVIHYRLPEASETYTHRSGRTARAGDSGVAIALISPEEKGRIAAISRRTGLSFQPVPLPGVKEIRHSQLTYLAKEVEKNSLEEKNSELVKEAEEYMSSCSKKELIQSLLSLYLPSLKLNLNSEAEVLDAPLYPSRNRRAETGKRLTKNAGLCRCFLNAGTMDGLTPASMGRFIAKTAGIQARHIQKIEMKKEFSLLDVDYDTANILKNSLKNIRFGSRKLSIRTLPPKKEGRNRTEKQRRSA